MKALVEQVLELFPTESNPDSPRFVVGVAGPPTAGKTTFAEALVKALSGRAAMLGMDAFHFDDCVLHSKGLHARKGSPPTFDVAGYCATLQRAKAERSAEVAIPVFDRSLELTRNAAEIIRPEHEIIVTEGNYLLFDGPWEGVADLCDVTFYLDVPMETIEHRIRERWADAGYAAAEIERRTTENDLPNARLIEQSKTRAAAVLNTRDQILQLRDPNPR